MFILPRQKTTNWCPPKYVSPSLQGGQQWTKRSYVAILFFVCSCKALLAVLWSRQEIMVLCLWKIWWLIDNSFSGYCFFKYLVFSCLRMVFYVHAFSSNLVSYILWSLIMCCMNGCRMWILKQIRAKIWTTKLFCLSLYIGLQVVINCFSFLRF